MTHYYQTVKPGPGNSNLEHVSDLLRVDVEVLARVDGDDGGAGKCLDEVIDISLPQSMKN